MTKFIWCMTEKLPVHVRSQRLKNYLAKYLLKQLKNRTNQKQKQNMTGGSVNIPVLNI